MNKKRRLQGWALAAFVGACTAAIQLGVVVEVISPSHIPGLSFSHLSWPGADAQRLLILSGIVVAALGIVKVFQGLAELDREDASQRSGK